MAKGNPEAGPDTWTLLAFVFLGMLAILFRDVGVAEILSGHSEAAVVFDASRLPSSLRVGTTFIEAGLRAAFGVAAGMTMTDPASHPFFAGSPWPFVLDGGTLRELVVPLLARIGTLLIVLSPVYWAAKRFFARTPVRVAYVAAIMFTLCGGPPLILNVFISAAQHFVDWPRSYYLWDARFIAYDLAAVGMAHLLAVFLARGGEVTPIRAAGLAALGQVFFENLGLATGLTLAAAAILLPAGRRSRGAEALRRLMFSGLGAASMLVVLLLATYLNTPEEAFRSARLGSIDGYFAYYWATGQHNVAWLNVTIANLLTVLVFPAFAGLALAGLSLLIEGRPEASPARREFGAAAIPTAALTVTILMGMANSNWEPARQALSVSALTVLAVAGMARWAAASSGARASGR